MVPVRLTLRNMSGQPLPWVDRYAARSRRLGVLSPLRSVSASAHSRRLRHAVADGGWEEGACQHFSGGMAVC